MISFSIQLSGEAVAGFIALSWVCGIVSYFVYKAHE